jgi:hypothetical protein
MRENRRNNSKIRRSRVGRSEHRGKHRDSALERPNQTNGLTRRQRHFILEKLIAQSDKDAALAAGYPPSMAANTKQKIWARAGVGEEYERLKGIMIEVFSELAKKQLEAACRQNGSLN